MDGEASLINSAGSGFGSVFGTVASGGAEGDGALAVAGPPAAGFVFFCTKSFHVWTSEDATATTVESSSFVSLCTVLLSFVLDRMLSFPVASEAFSVSRMSRNVFVSFESMAAWSLLFSLAHSGAVSSVPAADIPRSPVFPERAAILGP